MCHKWIYGNDATDKDGHYIRIDKCKFCGCLRESVRRYLLTGVEVRIDGYIMSGDRLARRPKCYRKKKAGVKTPANLSTNNQQSTSNFHAI